MTLPGNPVMSSVEFNCYDTMSYSPEHNASLTLDDHIYQHRPSVNAPLLQQQQEHQDLALQAQQQPLQIMQQTLPTAAPPLQPLNITLQQQKLISLEMRATTYPQQRQCEQTSAQFPTATASATVFSSLDLAVDNVMPGIYLTKNFIAWNEENLRSHGFTHIIIIDKHIQELYYPSPIFKLSTENTAVDAFDSYEYISHPACTSLKFGKEFEAIDLNFGEKSYLTTVLPNCYRAVRFINKAIQAGGTILVIDCNGSEQKCLTIVVAYLMYKHNISFSNAFARLKDYYKKADLDRFYMRQLYEYEPILQVQRAQSRGQSCSREMHSAILKRKKDDDDIDVNDCSNNGMPFTAGTDMSSTNEFFTTFNPLSNFHAATKQRSLNEINSLHECHRQTPQRNQFNRTPLSQTNPRATAIYTNRYSPVCDDYTME
ncbi:uncharacterized protein LOC118748850 [Rhagoletis pomonella]|uniref:uncharacterized protein LOC118748850 n=1 Tax=Rhagoletis pomonella TaxID=28610 RepID=UPI00177DA1C5|nr:uncharacterized protein LOC118748850 [Rhagoletis pomonella]